MKLPLEVAEAQLTCNTITLLSPACKEVPSLLTLSSASRIGPLLAPATHLCLATFLPQMKPSSIHPGLKCVSCRLSKSHTEAHQSSEHPKQLPHTTHSTGTLSSPISPLHPGSSCSQGSLAYAHRLSNVLPSSRPVCLSFAWSCL